MSTASGAHLRAPDSARLAEATGVFAMLSDATRLHLLWLLAQGESDVGTLTEHTDASRTAVSQHLAKLRLAGLVRGRREGTFVYYTAADEHVRALLAEALFHAEHTDRHLPDDTEHRHQTAPATPSSTLPL
jgi:DNA-binding transcriptional ArsR family regulator